MRPCSAHLKASSSSNRWLARQRRDPYVIQRSAGVPGPVGVVGETYRSRSSFKLVSLAKRYPLFPPGKHIIDLGAAPGGWSQVASRLVRSGGRVYALDILPFEPVEGVKIIRGDFLSDHVRQELAGRLGESAQAERGMGVGCVLSDMMAPMSGVRMRDVQASLDLVGAATDFAKGVLDSSADGGDGGNLVLKFFAHPDLDAFRRTQLEPHFHKVHVDKPKESRKGRQSGPYGDRQLTWQRAARHIGSAWATEAKGTHSPFFYQTLCTSA